MLTWLRGKSGSLLVKLMLGLLVVSFAVWGISGQIFTGVGNNVVQVGDTRVSINEYRLAYDRQLQMLSQQFGTRITREQARAFGIEQQVLSQLVAGAVLDEQAREMGLGLSEDRLAALTAEDTAFHNAQGRFDRNQFDFVLQQVGMRPEDYLRNREQVAIRQQIVDAVADGMNPPDTFLRAAALHRGEDRTVDFVTLPRSIVEPVADPADDVLQAWFEESAADYAAPEYRSFSYVKLEPEDIADPSAVSQEGVQTYFETHADSFAEAERRSIRQIVFPSREAAEEASARIESGEASFDEIAQELGRTPGDLELGTLARSDVPDQAIAEAAFEQEEGGTSGVIDGAFGPVLVNVDRIEGGSQRDIAEVETQIREELALDEANRILLDVHDAFEDARAGGATLSEAAEQQRLEVVAIDGVDAQGTTPQGAEVADVPEAEALYQAVFEAEPGEENAPLDTASNGFVFYEVEDVTPARDRTLDEVRDQVVADWKTTEARRLLAERAVGIAEQVGGGASLAEAVADLPVQVQTKRGLRRGADDVDLGTAGVDSAFSVPRDEVSTVAAQDGDQQIVMQVTEVFLPADATGEALPENVRQGIAAGYGNDIIDQLVTRLEGNYDITINQTAAQQALSF